MIVIHLTTETLHKDENCASGLRLHSVRQNKQTYPNLQMPRSYTRRFKYCCYNRMKANISKYNEFIVFNSFYYLLCYLQSFSLKCSWHVFFQSSPWIAVIKNAFFSHAGSICLADQTSLEEIQHNVMGSETARLVCIQHFDIVSHQMSLTHT